MVVCQEGRGSIASTRQQLAASRSQFVIYYRIYAIKLFVCEPACFPLRKWNNQKGSQTITSGIRGNNKCESWKHDHNRTNLLKARRRQHIPLWEFRRFIGPFVRAQRKMYCGVFNCIQNIFWTKLVRFSWKYNLFSPSIIGLTITAVGCFMVCVVLNSFVPAEKLINRSWLLFLGRKVRLDNQQFSWISN